MAVAWPLLCKSVNVQKILRPRVRFIPLVHFTFALDFIRHFHAIAYFCRTTLFQR